MRYESDDLESKLWSRKRGMRLSSLGRFTLKNRIYHRNIATIVMRVVIWRLLALIVRLQDVSMMSLEASSAG